MPRKTTKYNKSTYRSRWRVAMEKPCTWRTNSKVTPLYSAVSAHPSFWSSWWRRRNTKQWTVLSYHYWKSEIQSVVQETEDGCQYDRLLHEEYGLGSRIGCRGKKVNQPFGKKNSCEEAEGLESAKKCYHQCNRLHKRADYKEGDEAEQRQISSIISSPVGQQVQNSCPVLSNLPIQYKCTATPACQTVVYHFHGCQVTINYEAGVGVFQQSSN